ncbi:MAG: tRNA 5-methylaminomethyl-2-thiouridine biosynthesis bifunctional protein MnmC [Chlamydiales bacterium]|nr:tRNA 5-methylaminomethyl-2-thiouridine biosynthesis bifunctional protein MnmC [Chlamydiales bacterium]MCH9620579.1 tRNA 5-methylaminomethyl-2-thiouridine biosynthesis bifunctional protein MnmC [Chlamydiales bacterium]MCH9623549.1 tRNA 5-methylaminomethyl-2-thiouridine biosynthesis bifunctional protein MnmC [Chlamydiales bacterium]
MKVAILGAGFAGLGMSWYLRHYTTGSARIDFFDPNPIGGGASRISLGLLHPYMGKHARQHLEAPRCLKEVHRLMTDSAQAVNGPLITSKGVLRPAIKPDQIEAFKKRADEYDDLEWLDQKEAQKQIPNLTLPKEGGALYIKEALTVNVEKYLEGLWLTAAKHGAQFTKLTVLKKDQFASYDRVVIALGANALDFEVLKGIPMTRVKGQVIQLKWPSNLPPLPMSLSGAGQLIMSEDHKSCFAGSTYEREFTDIKSTPEEARKTILAKINPFFPHLNDAEMLGCQARVRASSKTRLPLLGKLNEKVWFMTGLGSKGFFCHAWAARQFVQAMILNDTKHISDELLCTLEGFGQPPQKS